MSTQPLSSLFARGEVAILGGVRTPYIQQMGHLPSYALPFLLQEATYRAEVLPCQVGQLYFVQGGFSAFFREISQLLSYSEFGSIPFCFFTGAEEASASALTLAANYLKQAPKQCLLMCCWESPSEYPLLWSSSLQKAWQSSLPTRLWHLLRLRLRDFLPQNPLHLHRLQLCHEGEMLVQHLGLSREELNRVVLRSHRGAIQSYEDVQGEQEIMPLYGFPQAESWIDRDELLKDNLSSEQLAHFPLCFPEGVLKLCHVAPICAGGTALIFAHGEYSIQNNLRPWGYLRGVQITRLGTNMPLLSGIEAAQKLLQALEWELEDVAAFWIHEASAATLIGYQKLLGQAFADQGWSSRNGSLHPELDWEDVNPRGGTLAVGYQVGGVALQAILSLLLTLKQKGRSWGIGIIHSALGEGAAIAVELAQ